ncbi:MAG: hypothetical protein AAGC55_09800, partial [Myxococcota bacterium]
RERSAVVAALLTASEDELSAVQIAAIRGLARVGGKRAVRRLQTLASSAPAHNRDPAVVEAARKALARLKN